ncbi:hypothetical protein I0O17_001357 [Campylobacter upsaliensis]|nr:hypothetical protein [Campylobacter upsaliensis]
MLAKRDGLGFRFLLRRCLATHRTGCERYALEAILRRICFAVKVGKNRK